MKYNLHHRSVILCSTLASSLALGGLLSWCGCSKGDDAASGSANPPTKPTTPVPAPQTKATPPAPAPAAEEPAEEASDGLAIPEVGLADAEPQVADLLRAARERVVREPDSAEAWGYFGQVCQAHAFEEASERCYAKAHELDPTEFKWAYLLAVVRERRGADLEKVIADLREATDLNPRYAPALYRLGENLGRAAKSDEARQAYERALEADRTFALAHRRVGQMLLAEDKVQEAVTHLESAAELLPEDGGSKLILAQAYWKLGDQERSEQATKEASGKPQVLEPADPILEEVDKLAASAWAAIRRGRKRMLKGDYQGAITFLEQAVERDPDDAEARVDLGTAYLHTRRPDDTVTQFRKALELQPDLKSARVKLGTALWVNGEFEEAVTIFEKGVELAPDDYRFYAGVAMVRTELREYDAAVEAGRRAVELAPDLADVHHILAKALMKRGDLAEAEAEFEETLRLAPKHPEAKWMLAEIRNQVEYRSGPDQQDAPPP